MKRLPSNATDGDVLAAVAEWMGLLADERYHDAYDFLYHPWLPALPVNEWDAPSIRRAVTGSGRDQPSGPYKVTPVEMAQSPADRKPYQDIQRYEEPEERAWDAILMAHGGAPSGATILGVIHFDLPLNGQWSDLTAIFRIVLHEGALVLALESLDVL